jgi:DNA-binding transcriptional ArsR family regulator
LFGRSLPRRSGWSSCDRSGTTAAIATPLLENPEVRRRVERVCAATGADVKLGRLIFDDPTELARRFSVFVEGYWREAFREEWERLEPRLADTVSAAGRAIATSGVYALVRTLAPRLLLDVEREEFVRKVPHDHRVEVTPDNRLLFVPSAFVWPHVLVNCDAPWPLSVVYPPPFVSAGARPQLPSAELVRVLRALGDDTRLRALRLISERPRSTQELAPLVGISEAGLSKHLRALAAAGLVRTKREGYYVLYSLDPERLEPLSATLLEFLGHP